MNKLYTAKINLHGYAFGYQKAFDTLAGAAKYLLGERDKYTVALYGDIFHGDEIIYSMVRNDAGKISEFVPPYFECTLPDELLPF